MEGMGRGCGGLLSPGTSLFAETALIRPGSTGDRAGRQGLANCRPAARTGPASLYHFDGGMFDGGVEGRRPAGQTRE